MSFHWKHVIFQGLHQFSDNLPEARRERAVRSCEVYEGPGNKHSLGFKSQTFGKHRDSKGSNMRICHWLKGKFTGNHRFLPFNNWGSCKFSLNQSIEFDDCKCGLNTWIFRICEDDQAIRFLARSKDQDWKSHTFGGLASSNHKCVDQLGTQRIQ